MQTTRIAAHLLGLTAGFLLPGLLVARGLRPDLRWGAAFVLSLLLLFNAALWAGVLGLPLRLPTVAAALLLPEVAFIDDPGLSIAEMRRRLGARGIRHVLLPQGLNAEYLRRHIRLYREDSANWRPAPGLPAGPLAAIPVPAGGGDRP